MPLAVTGDPRRNLSCKPRYAAPGAIFARIPACALSAGEALSFKEENRGTLSFIACQYGSIISNLHKNVKAYFFRQKSTVSEIFSGKSAAVKQMLALQKLV
jgi:hypothetical protein